jgi:hypothetical protein
MRRKTLKNPHQTKGDWGFPFFFKTPNLIFFVNQNSMQNFRTLGQLLLGQKYVARKRRKKEKLRNEK